MSARRLVALLGAWVTAGALMRLAGVESGSLGSYAGYVAASGLALWATEVA